jgi:hypothetical protein
MDNWKDFSLAMTLEQNGGGGAGLRDVEAGLR